MLLSLLLLQAAASKWWQRHSSSYNFSVLLLICSAVCCCLRRYCGCCCCRAVFHFFFFITSALIVALVRRVQCRHHNQHHKYRQEVTAKSCRQFFQIRHFFIAAVLVTDYCFYTLATCHYIFCICMYVCDCMYDLPLDVSYFLIIRISSPLFCTPMVKLYYKI